MSEVTEGRISEYADAGVDYTKIQPFKDAMVAVGKETYNFPERYGVRVLRATHQHGALFEAINPEIPHIWCKTQEGLGNKNWIAEWLYRNDPTNSYYACIGIDTAMMAVNDVVAQGAMPVIYTDEVAPGLDSWFEDIQRSRDLAEGFLLAAERDGFAIPAGESPAYKYLVQSQPPIESAPVLSGSITGIIQPSSRLVSGKRLRAGDVIIGAKSSGLHANGISLIIKRAMALPDQFYTVMPNNKYLGVEAMTPTMSYVSFVKILLDNEIEVHAFLPGTGDGIAKLSFDKRPFTYRVTDWLPEEEIPMLFRYMREIGVSLIDCLTTFNWGIGYYAFVPQHAVDEALRVTQQVGYETMVVGRVEEGPRQTIFGPAGDLVLPPPGE